MTRDYSGERGPVPYRGRLARALGLPPIYGTWQAMAATRRIFRLD